jgi:hypothetical protein
VNLTNRLQQWRDWIPAPRQNGRVELLRWILLDGNRNAITAALLTLVFGLLMLVGTVWPFEMRNLLTETQAIQTILNTLLSGIILLVSIVVSINSIVLSHDIASVEDQEDRIQAVMEFRRDVGHLTESGESPSDPASFLTLMGETIRGRAEALERTTDGSDEEMAQEIQSYVEEVLETVRGVEESLTEDTSGAEFGVLWLGLDVDYGEYMDHSRTLKTSYRDALTDDAEDQLDDLMTALRMFATGKQYFKTLYYTKEVSHLSLGLLVVSLPAILVNATAILAINAQVLPQYWVFGLPPLLSFVATVLAVSLIPFILLTAYMLRLATVAKRTAAAGPFSLQS